jgi:hypothetical protein
VTQMSEIQNSQATDESMQEFFLEGDSGGLNAWTTDELVTEVVRRASGDPFAVRRAQDTMLRALLVALDSQATSRGN